MNCEGIFLVIKGEMKTDKVGMRKTEEQVTVQVQYVTNSAKTIRLFLKKQSVI